MKRLDEELCKQKFDEFLHQRNGSDMIVWEDVAQQDEPPDYILHLNNEKYAVEVTRLIETIELQPQSQSSLGVSASLSRFVKNIEQTALRDDILHGGYVVKLWPLDNFSAIQGTMFEKALEYIRKTKSLETAPAIILLRQNWKKCSIQKLGNKKNYVGEAIIYEAKWEGEANQELCLIMGAAITEKRYKLRNIVIPKILLLLDSYGYTHITGNIWQDCLSKNKDVQWFHTIFVVTTNKNIVIHTQCRDWF